MKRWLAPLALLLCCGAAVAQTFPTRPLRLVIGFPAGSTTDVVARLVAQGMGNSLRQTVVVENRPGAASMIAAGNVAAASPDGYSLLFATLPTLGTATLSEKQVVDPINDFTPIALAVSAQFMLAGASDLPANNLADLIRVLKATPAKFQYGSSGNGSTIHLAAELFSRAIGVEILHVPYKGTSEVVQDLLGKKLTFAFIGLENLQHVKAGNLKAFAVSGLRRDPAAAELPTISEALPAYSAATTMLVLGPKAMPRALTETLNQAVNRALVADELTQKLKSMGGLLVVADSTPDSTRQFVREDVARWDVIVKSIKPKN